MALVHGYQPEACEQECEKEGDAVAVVDACDEHHEQHGAEADADGSWENVDAPTCKLDRRNVGALPTFGPGGYSVTQEAFHEEGVLACACGNFAGPIALPCAARASREAAAPHH